ncbi:MAG TPA: hypothetical protein P5137_07910 [Candidatus Brocadiia bacterium]|nr:hypothetical protein [Candidatus Brocadiia bacterium]
MSPNVMSRKFGCLEGAFLLAALAALVVAAVLSVGVAIGAKTIHELLAENKVLRQALANLTREDQIGYAKVVRQDTREGKVFTTLRFVETARDNPLKRVVEKEYTIEGDVIYFDALIVKFDDKLVMDGKERALYLWRRVYGESMAPSQGFVIEAPGQEPARYADLLERLRLEERKVFWSAIWDLASDPERLKELGVRAVFGNVVYSRLQKGLIYVFRISATGQVVPYVVPEM